MTKTLTAVDSQLAQAISGGKLDSYSSAFNPENRSKWTDFGEVPTDGELRAIKRKGYYGEHNVQEDLEEFDGINIGWAAGLIAFILDGWDGQFSVLAFGSKYLPNKQADGSEVAHLYRGRDGKKYLSTYWANTTWPEQDLILVHIA
jgi:hypothetical protein